jgi:hypothetical protein
MPELDLRALQVWFQRETMRPSALPARAAPRRGPRADDVLLPSRTLSARERLAIYSSTYFARLHDALAEDYPTVRRLLGPASFERLARAYLTRHPSRSRSLNQLGAKLPEFLARPGVRIPRRAHLRDVALLERAMAEVFDEEPSPSLDQAALEAIAPAAWARARLRVAHAFRLLELDHPANAIVSAARQERPLPSLARGRSWVVVYRKDFRVWRADLTRPMHAALGALARGRTIPAAIRAAGRVFEGSRADLERQVAAWFADWRREGIFQSVELT